MHPNPTVAFDDGTHLRKKDQQVTHTHTPTENNTPDADTHTHTPRTTPQKPQTNTSHTH